MWFWYGFSFSAAIRVKWREQKVDFSIVLPDNILNIFRIGGIPIGAQLRIARAERSRGKLIILVQQAMLGEPVGIRTELPRQSMDAVERHGWPTLGRVVLVVVVRARVTRHCCCHYECCRLSGRFPIGGRQLTKKSTSWSLTSWRRATNIEQR